MTLKNPMKTALTVAKRVGLWFEIYSLEITLNGQAKALEMIDDPMLAGRIEISRSVTRHELSRVRAAYTATLPIGVRRTWRMA